MYSRRSSASSTITSARGTSLQEPLLRGEGTEPSFWSCVLSFCVSLLGDRHAVFWGQIVFAAAFILEPFFPPQNGGESGSPKSYEDKTGAVQLLYALSQTAALIVVSLVPVDINIYWLQHQRRLMVFLAVVFVVFVVTAILRTPIMLVGALPFFYLVLRFKQVINQQKGFIRFSTLLLFVLGLVLVGMAVVRRKQLPPEAQLFVAFIWLLGPVAMTVVYQCSPWSTDSPEAVRWSQAVWCFLFSLGSSMLVLRVVESAAHSYKPTLIDWLWGPIHMLPLALMLCFHKQVHARLGLLWLQLKVQQGHSADYGPEEGSLMKVEEAIARKVDLDCPVRVGGEEEEMTLLILACWNGHSAAVERLLEFGVDVDQKCGIRGWFPLFVAAQNGHLDCIRLLLKSGVDVKQRATDGLTPLLIATAAGDSEVVSMLVRRGAATGTHADYTIYRTSVGWMGLDAGAVAQTLGQKSVAQVLRAYESEFVGSILEEQGCACVVSWPGIYAELWDRLVAEGKQGKLSAAVVFLPEYTPHYGQHGSDRCYCKAMYGEVKEWGCKLWRGHVEVAVANKQKLQVFFFNGRVGAGKVKSWEACEAAAVRRDSFWPRKQAFLRLLPPAKQAQLQALSSKPNTSAAFPGTERTERWDEEERLFLASLSAEDRAFLEGEVGLGSSQKAEVAWLEKCGYHYEELDVLDLMGASSGASWLGALRT